MIDAFSLKNKRILITGASSGIGRQCAIIASHHGATVFLIGRNKERLEQTYHELIPGEHTVFSQDLSEYDKLEEIVKASVEKAGRISGLVHSAGIELTMPLKAMTPEYYNGLFSLNVISGLELAKIISKKAYLDEEGASFIFISSIMGILGNSALVGYSASKGALISAVKSMAVELSSKRVRANCVSPGFIQTSMIEKVSRNLTPEQMENLKKNYLLGLGKPEDVANAVMFLLSDASRWITGINLVVDGGYSCR